MTAFGEHPKKWCKFHCLVQCLKVKQPFENFPSFRHLQKTNSFQNQAWELLGWSPKKYRECILGYLGKTSGFWHRLGTTIWYPRNPNLRYSKYQTADPYLLSTWWFQPIHWINPGGWIRGYSNRVSSSASQMIPSMINSPGALAKSGVHIIDDQLYTTVLRLVPCITHIKVVYHL